jgi:hydrogenase expression/formation protein HypE
LGNDDRVKLAHGSGGALMHELIENLIVARLANPILESLDDSAELPDLGGHKLDGGRVAFTTDSYVVQPLFFPGGDIGTLAVAGTVNDLSMKGATPLYLTLGLIIEEGLKLSVLEEIIDSIAGAAKAAGVSIAAGDTKVVEHGSVGGIIINTAGIGVVPDGISISAVRAEEGDVVILSGTIGDHETAILVAREELKLDEVIESDCACLNGLVDAILRAYPDIHVFRDPTRGGLGTTLNEIASKSGLGITIREADIPVARKVRAVCDILGYDPIYMANEGKVIVVVPEAGADIVLKAMRAHPLGHDATAIGIVGGKPGVYLRTDVGGLRPIVMLEGVQLPRIC